MLFARLLLLAISIHGSRSGAVDVLTNNYDNHRSGANLEESMLDTANVSPETFGRLFSYPVDGPVFSQPLIATGVEIPGQGARDVVYIATANNSVFAFDTQGEGKVLLWKRTFAQLPGGRAAMVSGILSTPVIDRGTSSIYVVTGFMDGSEGKFVLHALDLGSGAEKHFGPALIQGSVKIDSTVVPFHPTNKRIAVQRAALAIAQGRLIVAFGGDFFEGWVFSYDKNDLQAAPRAFCTICASRVSAISKIDYLDAHCILLGPGGGIWQSGRGPVVGDDGTVYFFTGNKQHVIKDGCKILPSNNACSQCAGPQECTCKVNRSAGVCRGHDACHANQARDERQFDTHDSLIALTPALDLVGWYRPENWNASGVNGLEYNDLDLGGSGPLLIPGTSRLAGGGKQGVMYLLDIKPTTEPCQPSLGRNCIAARALQSFQVAPIPLRPNEYYRHILGGPVLWARHGQAGGARMFVWRENDTLRSYAVSDAFEGCDQNNPAPTTSHDCPALARSEDYIDHHPGGILALSAHGGEPSSAIVWAAKHNSMSGPAKLMAFKASPDAAAPGQLAKIWDSSYCEGDALVAGSEFVPPTVANGKVYLATGAGRVEVFGSIPKRECVRQALPANFGPMMQ
ncbi:MAG: hypothetical protein EXR36_00740 [Betaproteobacteria bacterium]|nr:hypothetical protein [Betaproteobacteria bacterium]